MSSDAQAEREARAAAHLRRGEWADALRIYEELAKASPGDSTLAEKVARIRENLQPAELMHPKARTSAPDSSALSPEQEGERLFALGDYAGAAGAYRRALAAKPDSDLIRERLVELFRLAQAAPTHSPTDDALPGDPEARMQALLDRISARKRLRRE